MICLCFFVGINWFSDILMEFDFIEIGLIFMCCRNYGGDILGKDNGLVFLGGIY